MFVTPEQVDRIQDRYFTAMTGSVRRNQKNIKPNSDQSSCGSACDKRANLDDEARSNWT